MIIIFDLDYTLFDTARFKRDGLALFFNMNEAEFKDYYKRNFKNKGVNYSPKKHLQGLGWGYKEIAAKLSEFDDWLEKEISRYLFPEAEEILSRLKQAGHKIILASFGDKEFQEQKISVLKINEISAKEFFDQVIISDKIKAESAELKRFWGENILLVDDNLREAVELKEILGHKCEIFLIDGPYARAEEDDVVPRSLKELAEKFFPDEKKAADKLKNFGVVILAAGQGKRLNCADLPKVLYKINERPIISYILEELERSSLPKSQICLVVGFKEELVKEKIGPGYIYALQTKRLGTAHAALIGEKSLPSGFDNFLVINGDDSAFYKFTSLKRLIEKHLKNDNDMSILTCEPADPQGLGRVVRGDDGRVVKIVEKENLTPELEKIKEINTNTFCFKRDWFKKHYLNLRPISGLEEYGLPSFVAEALESGSKFAAVKLKDANEWFGVNTPEQLAEADKRKRILCGKF